MDNIKMPFLPEEALRTQRVEIYLNDLKERLKGLRLQHDEVIQNSVDIIKEIDEVSSELLATQGCAITPSESVRKIKKLIQEFETAKQPNSAKTPLAIESKVDIRKILENFEKLNESHVLKESLVLFKRAKESLEKIDNILGKMAETHIENLNSANENIIDNSTLNTYGACNITASPNSKVDTNPQEITLSTYNMMAHPVITGSGSSLKQKINMFDDHAANKIVTSKDVTRSCYASCCSSMMSIDVYQSTEDMRNVETNGNDNGFNSLEIGYEGDNDDSEYDLFAMKKKKNKITSPNM